MKYVFALIFISISAYGTDEEFQAIHKKYCDLKVEKACEAKKCGEDKTKCPKKIDQATAGQLEFINSKCEKDEECVKTQLIQELKRQLENATAFCSAGNQNYCYDKELIEGMNGRLSGE